MSDGPQHIEPNSRLTRLAHVALTAITGDPECLPDDQVIILIHNKKANEGGIGIHGYEPNDLMGQVADIFNHLNKLLAAAGSDIVFAAPISLDLN